MAATINGVAIRWGLPDLAVTETVVGSLIMQSIEHSKTDEPETIKNDAGQTVSRIWPDPSQEVVFEYFVKGTGVANAKLQSKIPAPGTIVTLSMTSTEDGETLNAAKAEVQPGPKKMHSNTGATKVTLPLKIWPLITSSASA